MITSAPLYTHVHQGSVVTSVENHFLYTNLKGKESWKDGQPHFHYISDKFGIPREKVVEQLKSNNYSLGCLPHIDIIGYRDKKE